MSDRETYYMRTLFGILFYAGKLRPKALLKKMIVFSIEIQYTISHIRKRVRQILTGTSII